MQQGNYQGGQQQYQGYGYQQQNQGTYQGQQQPYGSAMNYGNYNNNQQAYDHNKNTKQTINNESANFYNQGQNANPNNNQQQNSTYGSNQTGYNQSMTGNNGYYNQNTINGRAGGNSGTNFGQPSQGSSNQSYVKNGQGNMSYNQSMTATRNNKQNTGRNNQSGDYKNTQRNEYNLSGGGNNYHQKQKKSVNTYNRSDNRYPQQGDEYYPRNEEYNNYQEEPHYSHRGGDRNYQPRQYRGGFTRKGRRRFKREHSEYNDGYQGAFGQGDYSGFGGHEYGANYVNTYQDEWGQEGYGNYEGGYNEDGLYQNETSWGNDHPPQRKRERREREKRRKRVQTVDPAEDLLNFNIQVMNEKLREIRQDPKKKDMVNKLAGATMRVLRKCAEMLSTKETPLPPVKAEPQPKAPTEEKGGEESSSDKNVPLAIKIETDAPIIEPEQVITGVVRVGLCKKKFIIDVPIEVGDELVVLFKAKPTKPLVSKIYQYLKLELDKDKAIQDGLIKTNVILENNYTVTVSWVTQDLQHNVKIRFSSLQYSHCLADELKLPNPCPEDLLLDEADCCEALVKIRQIRWFDNVICLRMEAPVIQLFMFLIGKFPGFSGLNLEAIEVIINTCAGLLGDGINRYSLLVHALQVLACGILLPGMNGLACPYDNKDIADQISPQQRENITNAAQEAFRIVSFHGMEKLFY